MKIRILLLGCFGLLLAGLMLDPAAYSQAPKKKRRLSPQARSMQMEKAVDATPFIGVTTNGAPEKGLYEIRSTGVSTEPVKKAADVFLESLSDTQRAKTMHAVDDSEWRKWMNQHFYIRKGVGFDEMDETQRKAAFGLFRASLSADGLKLTRDIMRLNHTLGELTDNFDEYGEWLYWITVMGEPSATEPWGWQLDGHHVIINYFVMGDQVVMSPLFVGSEPVKAESGKFAGTVILQREQEQALALLQSLNEKQKTQAVIATEKPGNNNLTEAGKDNAKVEYAGIPGKDLNSGQRKALLELIGLYVGNMRSGHAEVRMDEVERHLDRTHFAWVGGTGDDAVFYYRILSPVVLIEFDHQRPIALGGPRVPGRRHIHAVMRTPNGNDYGKDLLRQHLERHPHGD